MRAKLDLLEEIKEEAKVRLGEYKRKEAQYHNAKVKLCQFKEGDLVMRKIKATSKAKIMRKLRPNWEDLFKVLKVLSYGSYLLQDQEGKSLPHTLNVEHLKLYKNKCIVHK